MSFSNLLQCFHSPNLCSPRNNIAQRLDDFHAQLKALQASVSPYTDNAATTIAEATADLRTSLMSDIEELKQKVNDAGLMGIINKHVEDYRTMIGPYNAEMEAMKKKLEPMMESLHQKMATNVEETKTALIPIVESIRSKLAERLQNLKDMASPYTEEYKEQMKQMYAEMQNVNPEEVTALKAKVEPLVEEIRLKLQEIFGHVSAAITTS